MRYPSPQAMDVASRLAIEVPRFGDLQPGCILTQFVTDFEKSMNAPVAVAINAQINPDTAGGVESSVMSIMRYYREDANQVEMTILGLPKHKFQAKFRDTIGPKHRVLVWKTGQERQVLPDINVRGWGRAIR